MMSASPAPPRPQRILIVDDEVDNRELLKIMLEWEGFESTTAESGEDALAAIADHAPDLVLLDLMMPGLDGFDVTGRMKQDSATRDIPIMIVTALSDAGSEARARTAGADDFVTKPFHRAELCARIRTVLGQR
jgi:DNA-binding response OmpR family regulator